MKFCPYCGADVINGSVSFCAECGKPLVNDDNKDEKPKRNKKKKREKNDRKRVEREIEIIKDEPDIEDEPETDPDFGYDGYYDDVLPADDAVERQQLDKATIKNLIIIAVGVIFAITICVVAMYLM